MSSSGELLELHILRHGKSSWDFTRLDDMDRPLTEKGVENVYQMAGRFFSNWKLPDLMISSPANRAIHTAIIYARTLRVPLNTLKISEGIYNSDEDEVLELIRAIPNSVKRLMIFGHNPTFTDLANKFLKQKVENIPTAGIISLQFNAQDWEEITAAKVVSEYFDFPKRYL